MKLKDLNDLLQGVHFAGNVNRGEAMIRKIEIDSRKVTKGDLFVAISGSAMDGHDFIESAIERGASAVLCSKIPDQNTADVVFVKVENTNDALGIIASNYYGDPSKKLSLIGVTGTNGKTTIATLLYELFTVLGFKCALLSTIENRIAGKVIKTTHTTPDLLKINELMAEMVEQGCDYAFMEVSSHAIDQKRIAGLDFDGAIFTNLTAEHLDYHNSFKEYVYTKKKFFDNLKPEAFALSNLDDKNGSLMLQNTKAEKSYYALKRMSDFRGVILRNAIQGLQMRIDDQEVFFKLVGYFNAYNALAVYGAARKMGFEKDEVLIKISALQAARGRFEIVYNEEKDITAIVDYAHTADALENVLSTINEVKEMNSKVISIAGAGGDRDRTKRPIMGKVLATLSETVIFTTDNPRSEEGQFIVDEMMEGVEVKYREKILTVLDRAEAIRVATKIASKGDIILIAGKGHETYQEIKGVRYPFDDKKVLTNIWFKK